MDRHQSEELGPDMQHMKSRIRIRNIVMRISNTVKFFRCSVLSFFSCFCSCSVLFYCSHFLLFLLFPAPILQLFFYPLLILLPNCLRIYYSDCYYTYINTAYIYCILLGLLLVIYCTYRGSCLTARINYPVMTPTKPNIYN